MGDDNIIPFQDRRARVKRTQAEIETVIQQLNQRYGLAIELDDPRLAQFKSLFPLLETAAAQQHSITSDDLDDNTRIVFAKGVELGRAQMMTDLIICILEKEGLIEFE